MKKSQSTYLFLSVFFLLLCAHPTLAADVSVPLQIPILGTSEIATCSGGTCSGIGDYISLFYKWIVAFAAVAAVLAFTYGGVLWLIAGGESSKVTESKKVMTNALVGFLLALLSYSLLFVINPKLTQFAPIAVAPINPLDLTLEKPPPPPDDSITPGGGGSIGVSRKGTPGRNCSGDEPTSLWRKVYSVPKVAELNTYIENEYRRRGLSETPLNGKAAYIIQEAQRYNIDVGLALGVWIRETQWWGAHGREGNYNLGDVTAKSCDRSVQCTKEYNASACKEGACLGPDRCYRCFTNVEGGISAWMAYASRYSGSATIADAIETYAPKFENGDTCRGTYVDLITQKIVDMAKISTSGDQSDRVKNELGCGKPPPPPNNCSGIAH